MCFVVYYSINLTKYRLNWYSEIRQVGAYHLKAEIAVVYNLCHLRVALVMNDKAPVGKWEIPITNFAALQACLLLDFSVGYELNYTEHTLVTQILLCECQILATSISLPSSLYW